MFLIENFPIISLCCYCSCICIIKAVDFVYTLQNVKVIINISIKAN